MLKCIVIIIILFLVIAFVYDIIVCDFCTKYLDENIKYYGEIADLYGLSIYSKCPYRDSSPSERIFSLYDNNIELDFSSREILKLLNKLKDNRISITDIYNRYNNIVARNKRCSKLYHKFVTKWFS